MMKQWTVTLVAITLTLNLVLIVYLYSMNQAPSSVKSDLAPISSAASLINTSQQTQAGDTELKANIDKLNNLDHSKNTSGFK